MTYIRIMKILRMNHTIIKLFARVTLVSLILMSVFSVTPQAFAAAPPGFTQGPGVIFNGDTAFPTGSLSIANWLVGLTGDTTKFAPKTPAISYSHLLAAEN